MATEPAKQEDRKHWSPSSLNMILRCPKQWWFRYVKEGPKPPGVAIMKGRAIDASANVNFHQKIKSHEDLKVNDMVDMAAAQFDTELAGGYELNKDETKIGRNKVLGHAKDSVVAMATVLGTQVAPAYQPTMVQQKFKIHLSGPRDLMGIIDFTDNLDRVWDLKTGTRKKPREAAERSIQLTAYSAGYKLLTGRSPVAVGLETVICTATTQKTDRQTLITHRTEADLKRLSRYIKIANSILQAGVFPPCDPDHWMCSNRWCGYWNLCEYGEGDL